MEWNRISNKKISYQDIFLCPPRIQKWAAQLVILYSSPSSDNLLAVYGGWVMSNGNGNGWVVVSEKLRGKFIWGKINLLDRPRKIRSFAFLKVPCFFIYNLYFCDSIELLMKIWNTIFALEEFKFFIFHSFISKIWIC